MIAVPRRSFLVGLGLAATGLAIGSFAEAQAGPDPKKPKAIDPDLKRTPGEGLRPNAFVHVAPNGVVSIVCARSEMGQGVRSSIPALVADELGADMAKVKILQGDGDLARYGDQNTDGSHSIRGFYDDLRRVGAAARVMLVAAAAKKWNVPEASCTARDHAVHHTPTKRSLGFGELAADAAQLPLPKKDAIALRPHSELKRVGKDLPLVDGPDIVAGRAAFGADIRLPGMLVAVIARPPVVGGKPLKHDATKALAVPGVRKVVELPAPKRPFKFQPLGGIAVLAENTWAAMRGRAALSITWENGDNAGYDSAGYKEQLLAAVTKPGRPCRNVGDVDAALAAAKKKVEAVYYAPHLAHATMEPPAAIARIENGKCEIWASTQDPQTARSEVAKAIGFAVSDVTIHVTFLGGGFGRKSKPDFVVEAALLAKGASAPVRVQWTREDDIQHDYYHSVSAQRLAAGIDEGGKVTAWHHRTVFPPIASIFTDATASSGDGELQLGVIDVPLAIPNVRAENGEAKAHTRIGWLRSVANIYHAFAICSFMDEIAHARGKDPRENLLDLFGPARIVKLPELGLDKLKNYGQPLDEHPIDTQRHRRVLERVTELSRWNDRKTTNRSLGRAVHRSFLTYVAVVVSVVKGPKDGVRVDEAWIVADAGRIVNAERVRAQMEGAVIFGLSHALYGEITMKGGATEQSNFRDFRLMRIGEAPRAIHVEIVPSEASSGGVGEPGVPPVAPALANAVFALTGRRVRELPIARSLGG